MIDRLRKFRNSISDSSAPALAISGAMMLSMGQPDARAQESGLPIDTTGIRFFLPPEWEPIDGGDILLLNESVQRLGGRNDSKFWGGVDAASCRGEPAAILTLPPGEIPVLGVGRLFHIKTPNDIATAGNTLLAIFVDRVRQKLAARISIDIPKAGEKLRLKIDPATELPSADLQFSDSAGDKISTRVFFVPVKTETILVAVSARTGVSDTVFREVTEALKQRRTKPENRVSREFMHSIAVLIDEQEKLAAEKTLRLERLDPDFWTALMGRGKKERDEGNLAEAEEIFQETAELAAELIPITRKADAGWSVRRVSTLNQLGEVQWKLKKFVEAEATLDASLALAKESATRWPDSIKAVERLRNCRSARVALFTSSGDIERTAEERRNLLPVLRHIASRDPDNIDRALGVVRTAVGLADDCRQLKRFEEASGLIEEALGLTRKHSAAQPENPLVWVERRKAAGVAVALARDQDRDPAEFEPYLREKIDALVQLDTIGDRNPKRNLEIVHHLTKAARALQSEGLGSTDELRRWYGLVVETANRLEAAGNLKGPLFIQKADNARKWLEELASNPSN